MLGNVANFVETEQLVVAGGAIMSYVQVRGKGREIAGRDWTRKGRWREMEEFYGKGRKS